MSDELIRMLNAPIDKERALARLWGEYDLAKDAESDTGSDSTGGDGAPFPGYTFPGTWSCHGGIRIRCRCAKYHCPICLISIYATQKEFANPLSKNVKNANPNFPTYHWFGYIYIYIIYYTYIYYIYVIYIYTYILLICIFIVCIVIVYIYIYIYYIHTHIFIIYIYLHYTYIYNILYNSI